MTRFLWFTCKYGLLAFALQFALMWVSFLLKLDPPPLGIDLGHARVGFALERPLEALPWLRDREMPRGLVGYMLALALYGLAIGALFAGLRRARANNGSPPSANE